MTESLVENSKTGKMLLSNTDQKNNHRKKKNDLRQLWLTPGIRVVLEKDAPGGGKSLMKMDQMKKELSLEWQLENVFKMNIGNMKKFLLLDMVTADDPQAWYRIDLGKMLCAGDNWVVGKMDPEVRKMSKNSPYPSSCVALGSMIYLICGQFYDKPSVVRMFYLDTTNPENKWIEGPSMNAGGYVGSAVGIEGKVYVFGHFFEHTEGKRSSGKVYDPVLNSWEPLSDPCEELIGEYLGKFVGSYDNKKILVHPCLWERLYAYDVVDKSWEVIDDNFGSRYCRGVIMDGVLYVFEYPSLEIWGYDLIKLKWLEPINLDKWFSRIEETEPQVCFFEVEANVLCLVYFDPMGKEGLDIYLKMFSIKKIVQEDGKVALEAKVFSSTIYKMRKKGYCVNYVVV